MLGPKYHHGGIRPLRSYGEALASTAGDHPEVGQGERVRRTVASRYGDEK